MEYKMLHACIRVLDLEKSLEFYKNALGLKEAGRKDFPEHKFTLVFLQDSSKNYELELTYNYDQKVPYTMGRGFGHFAFGVSDLEKSREVHLEMGYKVSDFSGLPGTVPSYYFVTDPDGFEIEIIRKK